MASLKFANPLVWQLYKINSNVKQFRIEFKVSLFYY